MANRLFWGAVLTLTYTLGMSPVAAQGLDDGWNSGGCVLFSGQSADFTREFKAYQTYFITADGLTGALDVDLQIVSSTGRILVEDVRSARSAIVEFRPSYTGRYTIRVKLASGVGRPICFFSVMVSSGGWSISEEAALTVVTKLAAAMIVLDGTLERFYGYVMRPGERLSMQIGGLSGHYSVFAVGSDNARDLDLTVSRSGFIIARDIGYDEYPMCEVTNFSGARLEVEVDYHSGKGAALVMVGIVKTTGGFGVQRL